MQSVFESIWQLRAGKVHETIVHGKSANTYFSKRWWYGASRLICSTEMEVQVMEYNGGTRNYKLKLYVYIIVDFMAWKKEEGRTMCRFIKVRASQKRKDFESLVPSVIATMWMGTQWQSFWTCAKKLLASNNQCHPYDRRHRGLS